RSRGSGPRTAPTGWSPRRRPPTSPAATGCSRCTPSAAASTPTWPGPTWSGRPPPWPPPPDPDTLRDERDEDPVHLGMLLQMAADGMADRTAIGAVGSGLSMADLATR